jgi:hypothetical protein
MKDPTFHPQTKHIDVMHHFICERVEQGEVTFPHVASKENLANLLTKSLARLAFSYLMPKLDLQQSTNVVVNT